MTDEILMASKSIRRRSEEMSLSLEVHFLDSGRRTLLARATAVCLLNDSDFGPQLDNIINDWKVRTSFGAAAEIHVAIALKSHVVGRTAQSAFFPPLRNHYLSRLSTRQ